MAIEIWNSAAQAPRWRTARRRIAARARDRRLRRACRSGPGQAAQDPADPPEPPPTPPMRRRCRAEAEGDGDRRHRLPPLAARRRSSVKRNSDRHRRRDRRRGHRRVPRPEPRRIAAAHSRRLDPARRAARAARSPSAASAPQFTRVRVNGLETLSTTATDGAAAPTATAPSTSTSSPPSCSPRSSSTRPPKPRSTKARSARSSISTPAIPLGGKRGFTLVGSAQASYNDLSKNVGPRVAGLLSWKSEDGTFGVAVSAAYQKTDTLELGNNTRALGAGALRLGRTARPASTTDRTDANGRAPPTPAASTARAPPCDSVALAFHPRIPRYGEVGHDRERLGLTGSVQWATERLHQGLDRRPLFELQGDPRGEMGRRCCSARTSARSTSSISRSIPRPTISSAARSTTPGSGPSIICAKSKTEFYQIGGKLGPGHVTDKFRFTLLGGISKSTPTSRSRRRSSSTTATPRAISYDYTDSRRPGAQLRHQRHRSGGLPARRNPRPAVDVVNKFRTAQAAHRIGRRRRLHRSSRRRLSPLQLRHGRLHPRHRRLRQRRRRPRARHDHLLARPRRSVRPPSTASRSPADLAELFTARQGRPAARGRPPAG